MIKMKARASRTSLAMSFAIPLLMAALPAQAAQSYQTDYRISLYGLSIAKASFSTKVTDGSYRVTGTLASSGLASLFDDTDGKLDVSGQFANSGPVPNSYVVKYRHGNRNKSTSITFANGNVTNTTNVPPIRKKKNWVELSTADLLSVADPISGVMVSADSPDHVCGKTLHLYDGQTRVDLKLSPSGKAQPFATKGFKGNAITCSAKFVPIAGYQSGRKAIEYLKNSSQISLTFASLGDSAIYSPVLAKVGTQIGTVTVYATRFEKVQ
ncbi:DUF3108 domain-containing protein [Phyllobacterium brassicacearum]|uniref:DUF3108 domain-containing protein n=2 Tax=Phyllobacterium brassicacearum TaxID=314235 RepID=A0A2P7BRS2_9HYPH|nr:DUF3108 domain-containing protein [Phyllobacterium brassicacearum]TDQ22616.1 uncharacterized protein DUF3108 [Phyllobacterium brassicacearum]